MTATSIDKIKFDSPINMEGSWGGRPLASSAESTMELWFEKDNTGSIEWCVDSLDIVEHIGLTFEIGVNGGRKLVDYDGVMSIPTQALDLLEKHGVDVTEMRHTSE